MATVTDQQGRWVVSNVPTGQVQIQAESTGFKTTVSGAAYDAGRPSTYNLTLNVAATAETVEVSAMTELPSNGRTFTQIEQPQQKSQQMASENVLNLQKRVAGVLPVPVDVPRAGTSFSFVRPLVLDEETKVTFSYKSR
jgi:hypothetical protein